MDGIADREDEALFSRRWRPGRRRSSQAAGGTLVFYPGIPYRIEIVTIGR
jgi:hypothetical protein